MFCWSFARAPRSKPLRYPAGPSPAIAAMAHRMWRSPSARTNSIAGRRISLRAGSPSKGEIIGNEAGAASIFATLTDIFWSLQLRDYGRCISATRYFPGLTARQSRITHDLIHRSKGHEAPSFVSRGLGRCVGHPHRSIESNAIFATVRLARRQARIF
jgi:hypothetical protein